jgi:hypothetical protein
MGQHEAKNLCNAKKMVTRLKKLPTELEKIIPAIHLTRE